MREPSGGGQIGERPVSPEKAAPTKGLEQRRDFRRLRLETPLRTGVGAFDVNGAVLVDDEFDDRRIGKRSA